MWYPGYSSELAFLTELNPAQTEEIVVCTFFFPPSDFKMQSLENYSNMRTSLIYNHL